MLQKRNIVVVLLLAICCFSIVWAEEQKTRTVTTRDPKTRRTVTKQVPVTTKTVDPHENTSVLVEAFLVRVSIEALTQVGVNPIGQSPEGISILKILACLEDSDNAQVISGTKLMVRHKSKSEMSNGETFYLKNEKVVHRGTEKITDVRYDAYESGIQFEAYPTILDGSIRIGYEYSQSGFEENEDSQSPPARYGIDWEGTVTLSSGQPVIAGAVQDDDIVRFLILTATIQEYIGPN